MYIHTYVGDSMCWEIDYFDREIGVQIGKFLSMRKKLARSQQILYIYFFTVKFQNTLYRLKLERSYNKMKKKEDQFEVKF